MRASQSVQPGETLNAIDSPQANHAPSAQTSTPSAVPSRASRENRTKRYEEALFDTVQALTETIYEKMPHSAYRDFYLWALSGENDERALWLQVIGARQIVQFVVELMGDSLDDAQWTHFARHTALMNSYLVSEVVSDNLGIGLAAPNDNDESYYLRFYLLSHFNQVMSFRLSGDVEVRPEDLTALQPSALPISTFTQSISPHKHRQVVSAYVRQHSHVSTREVEYSIWPMLVANFEACSDVADSAAGFETGTIIRQGLVRRYEAVNQIMHSSSLPLDKLVSLSSEAMLLIPTLAYYLEGMAQAKGQAAEFTEVVKSGTLAEALYLTSVLVRLLNDLGTQVIWQTNDERDDFLERLYFLAEGSPSDMPITDMLQKAGGGDGALLTCIAKDIKHGETNVALYRLRHERSLVDALDVLAYRLDYFSRMYADSYQKLLAALGVMSKIMNDDALSGLIKRCVRFHEVLYMKAFDAPDGEYAV
jgi:hypothetical protein